MYLSSRGVQNELSVSEESTCAVADPGMRTATPSAASLRFCGAIKATSTAAVGHNAVRICFARAGPAEFPLQVRIFLSRCFRKRNWPATKVEKMPSAQSELRLCAPSSFSKIGGNPTVSILGLICSVLFSESSEQTCLWNCSQRFMETQFFLQKRLMEKAEQSSAGTFN